MSSKPFKESARARLRADLFRWLWFIILHGEGGFDLHDPSTEQVTGSARSRTRAARSRCPTWRSRPGRPPRAERVDAYPAQRISAAIEALGAFSVEKMAGAACVDVMPAGVAVLIPWSSNAGFICNMLATALAAGRTAVVKPVETGKWADPDRWRRWTRPKWGLGAYLEPKTLTVG
ncbi:hypothetical protein [Burkholderia glumae]|uniref:hypothetical protein n=1 Tax=Burkholderia glumae TaxID=337 RepID=UPI001B8AE7E0|nr:hypothetical protein [Burkholderia glumae]